MSDDPGAAGGRGDLVSRLRAVVEAKDEQIAALTASLEAALARLEVAAAEAAASRERERRLGLRVAELERRLSMDSTDSGTPSGIQQCAQHVIRRCRAVMSATFYIAALPSGCPAECWQHVTAGPRKAILLS